MPANPSPFYLSANTINAPEFRAVGAYGNPPIAVIPVAGCSTWVVGNSAPGTATNGGSQVTRVDSVTSANVKPIPCYGATSALVCCRYDPSGSQTTTGPATVNLVGIDKNGVPQLLLDSNGNAYFSLAVASTDVASAANAYYTACAEVDLQNCEFLYVFIKTAATGTAFTDADAAIMVKLK